MFGEVDLKEMSLPMNIYDPFNSQGVLFATFYCLTFYGLILSTHIYMACDVFLFSSLNVANGALETVKERLREMRKYTRGEIRFLRICT